VVSTPALWIGIPHLVWLEMKVLMTFAEMDSRANRSFRFNHTEVMVGMILGFLYGGEAK